MRQSINLPLSTAPWPGGVETLRKDLARLGLDGVEGIWDGAEDAPDFPPELLCGYHLTFFPDWLDFYRGDRAALARKFGSLETAGAFYGGDDGPAALLAMYRADLRRALRLGAQYVVFHVSDVSVEEGYTYRWLHSDETVIDASLELINALLRDVPPTFDFLVENQWWPGFTFTDPAKTERLLSGIAYPRAGIMLDTGHLLNCDPTLKNQRQGLAYLRAMLDRHGALARRIRGLHLHQSLSGAYVRAHTGALPPDLPGEVFARFGVSYEHILHIDRHRPWTEPAVADLVREIAPDYVTHELFAPCPKARLAAAKRQLTTLRKGGL